jgi:hypothetical protein
VSPARLERCVKAVKAKGEPVNPYAVCKASQKKKGKGRKRR